MPTPPNQIHSYHAAMAALNLTQDPQADDIGLVVRPIQSASFLNNIASMVNSLNQLTTIIHEEDSVHVSGDKGVMSLAVRNDAGTALADDGDYIPFTTDNLGRLRTFAATDYSRVEDSPHTSGDIGAFVLGVRNDNNVPLTNANFDYTPLATDAAGQLKTVTNVFVRNDGAGSPLTAPNLGLSQASVDNTGIVYIQGQIPDADYWFGKNPVTISGVGFDGDVRIWHVDRRGFDITDRGVGAVGGTLRSDNTVTDFHFRREQAAISEDHACVVTIHPDTNALPITDLPVSQFQYSQGIRLCPVANTAYQITNFATTTKGVIFIARQNQSTVNSGEIYIGFSPTAANNYKVLQPDEEFTITAPSGRYLSLNAIYVVAQNANDGVCWMAVY